MMAETFPDGATTGHSQATRRDFLYLAAGGISALGTAAGIWPVIYSTNPAADVRALAATELDLEPIRVGQRVTVVWQGKPVFVSHRTEAEVEDARSADLAELRDPAPDSVRVQRAEWLIVVGVCTHLGCIPKGQSPGDPRGANGTAGSVPVTDRTSIPRAAFARDRHRRTWICRRTGSRANRLCGSVETAPRVRSHAGALVRRTEQE